MYGAGRSEPCRGVPRGRPLGFIYRSINFDRGSRSEARQGRRGRPGKVQSSPVSRILLDALANALATIPLGRRSPVDSSHLPAASPSRITGRLFGVAPRRDCPFHPTRLCLAGCGAFAPHPNEEWPFGHTSFAGLWRRATHAATGRLVSVALILTSRWAGVTCYAALRSPDFPRLPGKTRLPGRLCEANFTPCEHCPG